MSDNILKNLPLLTIGAFLLGFTYQYEYYRHFHLNILTYSSNIEFFYSLLPLTLIILVLGFLAVFVWYVVQLIQLKLTSKAILIVNGIGCILLILIKWYFNSLGISKYSSLPLLLIDFSLFAGLTYVYLAMGVIKIPQVKLFHRMMAFIVSIFFILSYSGRNAKVVVRFGNDYQYEMIKGDKTTKTNRTYFLVGQTQSHLFFYSKQDSTTTIVKRDNIDTLRVKEVKL